MHGILFRTVFIALTLVFSVSSSGQQVGVVARGVYYSVNPHLQPGSRLQILPDDGTGLVLCCATISRSAAKGELQIYDNLRDRKIVAYTLSLPQSIPAQTMGFGIVGSARFVRQGAHPEAILDDGLRLTFSTCGSMEGLHYLGRRVGDNKLLVHMYQYLDGEFEPTCRDKDLEAGGTERR
jgi:hypothetical protein